MDGDGGRWRATCGALAGVASICHLLSSWVVRGRPSKVVPSCAHSRPQMRNLSPPQPSSFRLGTGLSHLCVLGVHKCVYEANPQILPGSIPERPGPPGQGLSLTPPQRSQPQSPRFILRRGTGHAFSGTKWILSFYVCFRPALLPVRLSPEIKP